MKAVLGKWFPAFGGTQAMCCRYLSGCDRGVDWEVETGYALGRCGFAIIPLCDCRYLLYIP